MEPSSTSVNSDDNTTDLKCERCQYLLRGLDAAGNCPECGLRIAASLEAREAHRRRWDAWFRPTPPSRSPLAQGRPGWLWAQAAGVGLLVAVHVPVFIGSGVFGLPLMRGPGPDLPFLALAVCYAAGAWLLSWPEPVSPAASWRDIVGRIGLRISSLTPVAAAWLLWLSWNVVPWWNYGRYATAGVRLLPATALAEWLAFDHLSLLAAGTTRPGLYFYFRAARYAAGAGTLVLFLSGPLGVGHALSEFPCCCVPAGLIIFVLPTVLLAGFVPILFSAARAASSGRRGPRRSIPEHLP
jgi:hypothetical protein